MAQKEVSNPPLKANTTLFIQYRTGGGLSTNLGTNLINQVGTVSFFVNEARSFFAQKAVRKTVLPVSHNSKVRPFKDRQDAGTEDVLWEQPVQEILDFVARRYLRGRIIQLLFNDMRAEHSARFLAMESATKNAEKIIDKLTRQFNKMRQAMITKEISELSAGAVQR